MRIGMISCIVLLILFLCLPVYGERGDKVFISGDVTTSPPVPQFTANVTTGTLPFAVTFTDSSTNTPTAWNWSFGDGTFTIVQNPTHQYMTPGIYSVRLNVTNVNGWNVTVKTNYITVFPKGDFNTNWRVDIGDVTSVAYMAVNLTPWDPAADFNDDTKVDIGDASKIAWYYVGKVAIL